MLPNCKVCLIDGEKEVNLLDIPTESLYILDFWHTNCPKCPLAVSKLDEQAKSFPKMTFLSCALSQGPSNFEVVADLVNDWENMTHVFVETGEKDQFKSVLGFTSVPYYAVCDKSGKVIAHGNGKDVPLTPTTLQQYYDQCISNAEKKPSEAAPILNFTMDEDF